MSFLDRFLPSALIRELTPEPVQARAAAPFEVNIPRLFGRHGPQPWRAASVRDALGVPAILRCVTLISNTVGVLSMDAFRNGVKMSERPPIVIRPNPLSTPRVFWRDTAYHLATRGEAWWWVAKRDADGLAQSLWPVPPWEVKVEENHKDLRYPIIRWRDRVMPNADFRQLTLLMDSSNPLRGSGPLQDCGAAISVAVESQEWAANFYAEGGFPSVWMKMLADFADEDEATKFKEKWISTPKNTPHLLTGVDEIGNTPVDEAAAQMLTSREFQVGEAGRMFGIDSSLLSHAVPGSALTYQNLGDEFDKFIRSCLWPNYTEAIEQEMTDLLPRSTIGRFDFKAMLRPNPKTRAEIYEKLVPIGIQTVEEARVDEGYDPGSIETAPIPPSPPAALPPVIEARAAMPEQEVRCDGLRRFRRAGIVSLETCGVLLAEVGPFTGRCRKCKKEYAAVAA